MDNFLINPLTIWLFNVTRNYLTRYRNRGKHLLIDYLSKIKDCRFGTYNTIYKNVSLTKVELGDFTYVADDTTMYLTKIGKFCSIGPNVRCGGGSHPTQIFVSTHPAFYSTKRQAQVTFVENDCFGDHKATTIGNDVFIGANVFVVDGVNIGDGAIVGAGAVVTKDVPPYTVVGGVPARVLKQRFSQEDIDFLLSLKWWERGEDWLRRHSHLMQNIRLLRKAVDKGL